MKNTISTTTKQFITIIILLCSSIITSQENKFPDSEVINTKGEKVSILNLIDKLTIIDYWATWCGPCIKEMPYLDNMKKKYGNKLEVVTISVDQSKVFWDRYVTKKNKSKNQFWVGKENPVFQLITDRSGLKNGAISTSYSIPKYFLISKEGYILDKNCPEPSSGLLEGVIEKHL